MEARKESEMTLSQKLMIRRSRKIGSTLSDKQLLIIQEQVKIKRLKRYQTRMLERARALGATETDKWLLEVQEIMRKNKCRGLATFCNRFRPIRWIAHFIWSKQSMACGLCGALVGMNSVVWRPKGWKRGVMTCWPCNKESKENA